MTRGSSTSEGGKATLTLLDLAHDASTIRGLADRRQDRAHTLDKVNAQFRGSKFKGSLDDIVAIGVAHELLELFDVQKLSDHHGLGCHVSTANTLLNDIGAELLLRKLSDLALEAQAHRGCEGRIVQIKNVLNDVVAKGILYKVEAVCGDLANQVDLLKAGSVVNAALKNAAAMPVGTNSNAMLAYSVENKLSLRRLEMVQALLDNVIAVQVLDKVHNLAGQSPDNHLSLQRGQSMSGVL